MKYAGELITKAREERKMTLRNMFDLTGISVSTIKLLEEGANTNPQINTLSLIGQVLNIPLAFLVADWDADAMRARKGIEELMASLDEKIMAKDLLSFYLILHSFILLRKMGKQTKDLLDKKSLTDFLTHTPVDKIIDPAIKMGQPFASHPYGGSGQVFVSDWDTEAFDLKTKIDQLMEGYDNHLSSIDICELYLIVHSFISLRQLVYSKIKLGKGQ